MIGPTRGGAWCRAGQTRGVSHIKPCGSIAVMPVVCRKRLQDYIFPLLDTPASDCFDLAANNEISCTQRERTTYIYALAQPRTLFLLIHLSVGQCARSRYTPTAILLPTVHIRVIGSSTADSIAFFCFHTDCSADPVWSNFMVNESVADMNLQRTLVVLR